MIDAPMSTPAATIMPNGCSAKPSSPLARGGSDGGTQYGRPMPASAMYRFIHISVDSTCHGAALGASLRVCYRRAMTLLLALGLAVVIAAAIWIAFGWTAS